MPNADASTLTLSTPKLFREKAAPSQRDLEISAALTWHLRTAGFFPTLAEMAGVVEDYRAWLIQLARAA